MSQDEFTKLFTYMQEQFTELRAGLEGKADKDQVEHIYDLLDRIAKQQETDQQERLVIDHQISRHEGWIKQLAQKTGSTLGYE